jgi:hypothetical protein
MLSVWQILRGRVVALCQEMLNDCAGCRGGYLASSCLRAGVVRFCGLLEPAYRESANASLNTSFRAVSYRHLRSLILCVLSSLRGVKVVRQSGRVGGSAFWVGGSAFYRLSQGIEKNRAAEWRR